MNEKKLTDENYKKILDGVMEQAEKDFGEVVVENMFDEAVIDTLKEMAIKHSNDSYGYRVFVNTIRLINRQKTEIERLTEELEKTKDNRNGWRNRAWNDEKVISQLTEKLDKANAKLIEEYGKNAKLQKQVDDYEKALNYFEERDIFCEDCKSQAVKDTAKEIFKDIFESLVFGHPAPNEEYRNGYEQALYDYDEKLRKFAKECYGVEVK